MVVLPKTQVLNSATFRAPPLHDRSLTLPDLYDWQYEHSPDHPLFLFEDQPRQLKTIDWRPAVRAMHRAAHFVASKVPSEVARAAIDGRPIVVGTLATTDTITYVTTEIGIIRAGFAVFPISPRNSPEAVAHLLRKTGTKLLLVSGEPVLQSLAAAVQEILNQDEERLDVIVSGMPLFEDIYPDEIFNGNFELYPTVRYDLNAPALIIHSSGSTSFPKPIPWFHKNLVTLCYIPWYGEMDLCGLVMSCHAMPVFHGMGLLQLALVVWSKSPEAVNYLKKMKALMWGGGPLPKAVGDHLTAEGVIIHSQYGCTECGVMNTVLPAQSRGEDWEYLSFSAHTRPIFVPQDDGTFELVMTDHPAHHPVVLNTTVDGCDAYATSDLVTPHPTKPGLWKVFGRSDDQIMLSTGEKTNPGPLEGILNQDPHIVSSVMFGRGKFQNGVLIDPKPQFAFDPSDKGKLEEFRNVIWPTVERMNEYAPQHSRLFKEMIMVALPSKPFVYTAKLTARRQAILKEYEAEIDVLYDTIEESSQSDIAGPAEWSPAETLAFVQQVVAKVLKQPPSEGADLFQHGCDSLQATWIRNSVLRALRDTAPEVAKRLPTTFVYHCPTVNQMVNYLCRAVANPQLNQKVDLSTRGIELQAIVNKYSSDFPTRGPVTSLSRSDSKGEVCFVTGTTGGLGSNVLSQLLLSKDVYKVYVFNRPSSASSLQRHEEAFSKRGLDKVLLSSPKLTFVEGELSEAQFGIDQVLYDEIQKSVTHIIHIAWRINLNLSLLSFESNIVGVRKLVDLALSSPSAEPPRVIFVSSISVFINFDNKGYVKEEVLDDSKIAVGTGYSESKWVAERILDAAAEKTPLRPVVVRLGQVSGDVNGSWNESEWFPSVVKSALSVKCLPDLDGLVSWITSPHAAAALIEMAKSPYRTLHLAHPRAVTFTSLIKPIAAELGVPLVPYTEWLDALEKDMDDTSISQVEHLQRNPALRLLDFFRHARIGPEWEPVAVARLGTDKAVEVSKTLREDAPTLGVENVKRWLQGWRKSGFLS
ncbi:hypothetical protein EW146_g1644 [Bondarzewia mesenterica]|uniref:Polyketide synthase-like phosphopantetheine-binding domain-containing protein n=1 Tax=Bondarzewia mesenterica TaxID=1095465 RepID=A0A4S4M4M5_9AGAM|nr:hypothetical protein EW146_g1644 [Bondarzewia mesenterica]